MYVAPLMAAGTKHPNAIWAQWPTSKCPAVNASALSPADMTRVPTYMLAVGDHGDVALHVGRRRELGERHADEHAVDPHGHRPGLPFRDRGELRYAIA